jgi:hypothetical protein
MNWLYIDTTDTLPPEGEYVLCMFDDDFVGISAFVDGEWEISGVKRRPIYKGTEKKFTSCDPQYWKKL